MTATQTRITPQELSSDVLSTFEEMTSHFEGPKFTGILINYEPLGSQPDIASSVFSQILASYEPRLEGAWPIDTESTTPINFKAQITIKPNEPNKYLAARFLTYRNGTGGFEAHLETNDSEYVRTHPQCRWQKA